MPPPSKEPWTAFACRIPEGNPGRWNARDATRLDKVYHVTHVVDACRILSDGKIKAGRIGDESILKRTTASVAWVSPNTWVNGSIFGSVEFAFDWNELIDSKNVYWVERMDYRRSKAYRFLVTANDHDSSKYVRRYDPRRDNGPLLERGDDWYCNMNDVAAEFMLEKDLPLRRCRAIRAITHNRDCKRGSSCVERNLNSEQIAAQVIAYAISHRIRIIRDCFKEPALGNTDQNDLRRDVLNALRSLFDDLNCDQWNRRISRVGEAEPILRGALALYGNGLVDDARDLVASLSDNGTLRRTLESIVAKYFKLDTITLGS
jgi:hypothetical protein